MSALAAVACLLVGAASSAGAEPKVLHAAPDAKPTAECTLADPCALETAVEKAVDGDEVLLEEGRYRVSQFSGLPIEKAIDIGGVVGSPATLETSEHAGVDVSGKAEATLHDLDIEGAGPLVLGSGTAERISVTHFGIIGNACELWPGTTLVDSVCWTKEEGEEEVHISNAVEIVSNAEEGNDKPVTLVGDTAIADTNEGNAIKLVSAGSSNVAVYATGVIARSVNDTDLVAELDKNSTTATANMAIVNSDFGETEVAPGRNAITPVGANGNTSAMPSFFNLAAGDFRVLAGSPTIDTGGAANPLLGKYDLAGQTRVQAGCIGGTPIPDMGAYERTATAPCPVPPPPPPPPVIPRGPIFRVVSLVLNKKTGAGRILVEVPGPGTLSLTGSGVKLVRRTAPPEGGVISVPIQTWAITKVRLAKAGKTRVHLRVAFEGRGSGLQEWRKAVLLRKSNG